MSILEASLGDSLLASMHCMEFALYRLRISSSLSLSKASSASSSLTSIAVMGWEVPSPDGSGCKEVSPSLTMSYPPQMFIACMREITIEQVIGNIANLTIIQCIQARLLKFNIEP
jgi:hypothetical protein